MSDVIEGAVAALSEKLGGQSVPGTVKFDIEGEGSIIVDSDGVRAGDGEADVTLSADAETFQSVLSGDLNPTSAFMQGKLAVDGDMGMAMQLGTLLS
jgi:putative sterol carrier protein